MTEAELHSAGATVRRPSPFADLPVPSVASGISLPEWTAGLFGIGLFAPDETADRVGENLALVDANMVRALLSVFNWRPRVVGAHLAALRDIRSLEQDIGNLLLRSDVCYAGSAYALALARFNTRRALQFLTDYLDYYLTRKDLWFEQCDVLAAVICLDERNGTTTAKQYESRWRDYVRDKPNVKLDTGIIHVRHQLQVINARAIPVRPPRDAD